MRRATRGIGRPSRGRARLPLGTPPTMQDRPRASAGVTSLERRAPAAGVVGPSRPEREGRSRYVAQRRTVPSGATRQSSGRRFLVARGRYALSIRWKTDTVVRSLTELVRTRRIDELKSLVGRVNLGLDLDRSRRRPPAKAAKGKPGPGTGPRDRGRHLGVERLLARSSRAGRRGGSHAFRGAPRASVVPSTPGHRAGVGERLAR
jgi:hypothetical protein